MKVTGIEAIPFSLPLRRPTALRTGTFSTADQVLVRVHTDEGLVGQAEAAPLPMAHGESQESVVAAIRDWLGPALKGLDPLALEQAWERMAWVVANDTAKAAVDLALHDVVGQAVGRPCHVLLGGYADEISVTHLLFFGSPGRGGRGCGNSRPVRRERLQAKGRTRS